MGKGIIHKIGTSYIRKGVQYLENEDQDFHSFTENQIQRINKISYETYFWSALIGVVAVLAVVLPFHFFQSLFGVQQFMLFGFQFEFELYYTLYAILMLFPEIWLLNFVNLRAVKKICVSANFPPKGSFDSDEQIALLAEAGLEIPAKHLDKFTIDPFVGLSKFSYYSLFLLNKLKATLSNIVVKLIVKRFLGRYALRIVTDLAGIPIFAFWNAWASRTVIKEAKMRIMATAASREFLKEIEVAHFHSLKNDLSHLFHFIAQQKRAYNFALFAFMNEIVSVVPDIEIKEGEKIHLNDLFGTDIDKNLLLARLLVFGLIIDGTLSSREKKTLEKLSEMEWFPYGVEFLENATKEYSKGLGLPKF